MSGLAFSWREGVVGDEVPVLSVEVASRIVVFRWHGRDFLIGPVVFVVLIVFVATESFSLAVRGSSR